MKHFSKNENFCRKIWKPKVTDWWCHRRESNESKDLRHIHVKTFTKLDFTINCSSSSIVGSNPKHFSKTNRLRTKAKSTVWRNHLPKKKHVRDLLSILAFRSIEKCNTTVLKPEICYTSLCEHSRINKSVSQQNHRDVRFLWKSMLNPYAVSYTHLTLPTT